MKAKKDIPRPEYPRPQFKRDNWLNLNGEWEFTVDDQEVGEEEEWFTNPQFDKTITVPYCYQSELSGVELDSNYHPVVWYKREFELPENFGNKNIFINFEAVDYKTRVWVNGKFVGEHTGGHVPFKFDITNHIQSDSNQIVVKVEDRNNCFQPLGKQSWKEENFLCWYTRTTGIWQTVWLEAAAEFCLEKVKITPHLDQSEVEIEAYTNLEASGMLEAEIYFEDNLITKVSTNIKEGLARFKVDVSSKQSDFRLETWTPTNPNLYDVKFKLKQEGSLTDEVQSYFGMREIDVKPDGTVLLNNKEYYQKLVLDQGYYGAGMLTARSDQDFVEDIKKTKEMGFNGVRKHQKIEDRRFMYWCDKLGLLMWAEMPSAFTFDDRTIENLTYETRKMVDKHYNHPSVIAWVPLNESWGVQGIYSNQQQQNLADALYHLIKAMDGSRLVISNDGWEHTTSDLLTIHDYVEKAEVFKEHYQDKAEVINGSPAVTKPNQTFAQGYKYNNQPIMISEYGGIAFEQQVDGADDSWGYGHRVSNETEFLDRFKEINQAIMDTEYIVGFCYTQLTDVEQEINGLLDEEHNYKFNPEKIREILEYKHNNDGFLLA